MTNLRKFPIVMCKIEIENRRVNIRKFRATLKILVSNSRYKRRER